MWDAKRDIILKRDNYTCQMCNTFNPQIGRVEIFNEESLSMEFHEYENYANGSIYNFSNSNPSFTFQINFGDCYLVLPVLQIHHKRYILGKKAWEYSDEDLITLCKSCHTKLHQNCKIPFYTSNNIYEYKNYEVEDSGTGRFHNFLPWRFIRKNEEQEYIISDIHPKITMVLFSGEGEIKTKSLEIMENFIKKYLPDYSKK